MSTITAQPSAWGPSANQRKSGTPSSRSRLRALGIVQIPRSATGSVSVVAAIAGPYEITYLAPARPLTLFVGHVRYFWHMTDATVPPRAGLPRPVELTALRDAVADECSWRGVMRRLGFTTSRTGRVLRQVCDEHGIDYAHFRLIGPDDQALMRVVPE